jgi:hypothetical protein
MRNWIAILAAVAGLSGGAMAAEQPWGIQVEIGGMAIDEARRALNADIQDWTDDRAELKFRSLLGCGGLAPSLPELMREIIARNRHELGPDAPLTLPASEVAARVALTPTERVLLGQLMSRETPDEADRVRLAIDTQAFMMKVSGRLFDERIQALERDARTGIIHAVLGGGEPLCDAHWIRSRRDEALIAAGHRLLGFYDQLEKLVSD